MAEPEWRNQAKAFLDKAEEYLLAAQMSEEGQLWTAAAGAAIHAGISAKDAIAVALTGSTAKHQDHARAADELGVILGEDAEKPRAVRAIRDLLASKTDVEYTHRRTAEPKARLLVRRAETLVEIARRVV